MRAVDPLTENNFQRAVMSRTLNQQKVDYRAKSGLLLWSFQDTLITRGFLGKVCS